MLLWHRAIQGYEFGVPPYQGVFLVVVCCCLESRTITNAQRVGLRKAAALPGPLHGRRCSIFGAFVREPPEWPAVGVLADCKFSKHHAQLAN